MVHFLPGIARTPQIWDRHSIAPQSSVLTVLGGDFNYVTDNIERVSTSTASSSNRRDTSEERHFNNVVSGPFGLQEMFQAEPTHALASARSRLGRMYCNQHVVEQLDRHIKAVALEWNPHLSHHRAVLFSQQLPQKLPSHEQQVHTLDMKVFLGKWH